jgi:hypothetical protein
LSFILPFGAIDVVGALGLVEVDDDSFGGALSFLGFFVILLLRCSPLAMCAPY